MAASEIAAVEQELVAEGIPEQEIKGLCDFHARMMGGAVPVPALSRPFKAVPSMQSARSDLPPGLAARCAGQSGSQTPVQLCCASPVLRKWKVSPMM